MPTRFLFGVWQPLSIAKPMAMDIHPPSFIQPLPLAVFEQVQDELLGFFFFGQAFRPPSLSICISGSFIASMCKDSFDIGRVGGYDMPLCRIGTGDAGP